MKLDSRPVRRDRRSPPGGGCEVYWPGHVVHHIQALKAINDLANPGVEGEVIEIAGFRIVVRVGGVLREFWNHEADRLARLVEHGGPTVIVQEQWRVLRFTGIGEGSLMFCIATSRGEYRACPRAAPEPGDSVGALIARGGGHLPVEGLPPGGLTA